MIDKATLLEAHVRYELDHWCGDSLESSVAHEVAELAHWLGDRRVDRVVTPGQVTDWIMRYASELPVSERLISTVAEIVRSGHDALGQEHSRLSEVLPQTNFDQFVTALLGMADIRQVVPARVTRSAIYAQLVNHLLRQGIKAFVLKENVLARRLPGASSLLRFGQNAISSTAPNLERVMDRQLATFIKANIAEAIGDSERYLHELLDDEHLRAAAEEIWAQNSGEPLGEMIRLLDSASLDRLIAAGRDVWLHLRQTPLFAKLVELVVAEFFRLHGEQPIATLLADYGIELSMIEAEVTAAVVPVLMQARDEGFLEARIRDRLAGFYSTYLVADEVPAAPAAAPRKRAPARRKPAAT
jgi:hypothetical protein